MARAFPEHIEVSTVQLNGWSSTSNGALLRLAAQHGYEAIVTADKGFEHQHNNKTLPIAVIILRGYRTRLSDLLPTVPRIVALVQDGLERNVYRVDA